MEWNVSFITFRYRITLKESRSTTLSFAEKGKEKWQIFLTNVYDYLENYETSLYILFFFVKLNYLSRLFV